MTQKIADESRNGFIRLLSAMECDMQTVFEFVRQKCPTATHEEHKKWQHSAELVLKRWNESGTLSNPYDALGSNAPLEAVSAIRECYRVLNSAKIVIETEARTTVSCWNGNRYISLELPLVKPSEELISFLDS